MEDEAIIALYEQRSENAIIQTKNKYGRMLVSIALGILRDMEDARECESDTYLHTWNVIPPQRPAVLSAFLSRITRNLSLNRYEERHARKRGGGEVPLLLDELAECIPGSDNTESFVRERALRQVLDDFLGSLRQDARIIFMRRYWYCDSVQEISARYGYGTSKIKMSLLRSRKELRKRLEEEGWM